MNPWDKLGGQLEHLPKNILVNYKYAALQTILVRSVNIRVSITV